MARIIASCPVSRTRPLSMMVSATADNMATSCATIVIAMDGTKKDGRMVMMEGAKQIFRIKLNVRGLS